MSDLYSHYTDFLKDEKFLRWQLLPDKKLDEYWKNFIRENPDLNEEMQHAIADLKTIVLNKNILSESDRLKLFHRIQSTLNKKRKKAKIRRIIQYGAAACAAIALLIIGLNYFNTENMLPKADDQELIIGNLLQSEDIQLISGEKSHEYQNDIEVKIDEKGTAKVVQTGNNAQEQIDISNAAVNKIIPQYPKMAICMLHITGLNRKLSAKSECNFSQNEVWVNSHLLVDST